MGGDSTGEDTPPETYPRSITSPINRPHFIFDCISHLQLLVLFVHDDVPLLLAVHLPVVDGEVQVTDHRGVAIEISSCLMEKGHMWAHVGTWGHMGAHVEVQTPNHQGVAIKVPSRWRWDSWGYMGAHGAAIEVPFA